MLLCDLISLSCCLTHGIALLGSEIAYSRSPQGPIQLDAALNELETESAVKVLSSWLRTRFLKLYSTFQEAVHLIREGKDNDQPCRRVKHVMIAYAIVHHPLYYWIHFLSTLALMTLAFWEQEAVSREENTLEEKAVTLYDNSFNGVGSMLITCMYRCT